MKPAERARDPGAVQTDARSRAFRERLRPLGKIIPLRSSRGILLATMLLFLITWLLQPESLAAALERHDPVCGDPGNRRARPALVIQQGGIDLSVPGVVSLSGVSSPLTTPAASPAWAARRYGSPLDMPLQRPWRQV